MQEHRAESSECIAASATVLSPAATPRSNLATNRPWSGAPVVKVGYRIKSGVAATPEVGSEKRQGQERPGRFAHTPTKPEAQSHRPGSSSECRECGRRQTRRPRS